MWADVQVDDGDMRMPGHIAAMTSLVSDISDGDASGQEAETGKSGS
jgi:hypothetical protein